MRPRVARERLRALGRELPGRRARLMVDCKDCQHFRELPGDTVWKRRTGCYFPDFMEQKQADPFLAAQEVPGDHEKLNGDGNCAKFSARRQGSLMSRLIAGLRS